MSTPRDVTVAGLYAPLATAEWGCCGGLCLAELPVAAPVSPDPLIASVPAGGGSEVSAPMGLLTPSPVATSAPKRLANVRLEGIVSEDVRSVIMLRDVFQVRKHIRRARVHQPTQGGSVNRLGVKPRGTRLVFSVELSYGSRLQLLFQLFRDRIFFQM